MESSRQRADWTPLVISVAGPESVLWLSRYNVVGPAAAAVLWCWLGGTGEQHWPEREIGRVTSSGDRAESVVGAAWDLQRAVVQSRPVLRPLHNCSHKHNLRIDGVRAKVTLDLGLVQWSIAVRLSVYMFGSWTYWFKKKKDSYSDASLWCNNCVTNTISK